MRRRKFISLLGGAAAWPLRARAQQPERIRRISVLSGIGADDPESQARIAAFVEVLQQLGWTDNAIWYTDNVGGHLGRLDPATGHASGLRRDAEANCVVRCYPRGQRP